MHNFQRVVDQATPNLSHFQMLYNKEVIFSKVT